MINQKKKKILIFIVSLFLVINASFLFNFILNFIALKSTNKDISLFLLNITSNIEGVINKANFTKNSDFLLKSENKCVKKDKNCEWFYYNLANYYLNNFIINNDENILNNAIYFYEKALDIKYQKSIINNLEIAYALRKKSDSTNTNNEKSKNNQNNNTKSQDKPQENIEQYIKYLEEEQQKLLQDYNKKYNDRNKSDEFNVEFDKDLYDVEYEINNDQKKDW